MLDDGCRYQKIIAWLNNNGHPGIKRNNLTEWRKGGFQEWLDEQRELAREEKVLELSHKIATTNEESKAHEAAIRIATNFLFRVFLKFDSDKLARELDLKPTQVTTVLNAFSRISRRSNELDMLKDYSASKPNNATPWPQQPPLRPCPRVFPTRAAQKSNATITSVKLMHLPTRKAARSALRG